MAFDGDRILVPKRRRILATCFTLAVFTVIALLTSMTWTSHPSPYMLQQDGHHNNTIKLVQQPEQVEMDPLASGYYLKGPPTDKFRDNLLPDVKYITSWISAGWTNDVMTYINLIYLSVLTNRIPIIAVFSPSHIGGSVPPVNFGEVFDVPRLRKGMNRPLLEWHEVKNATSNVLEELGCWNTWESVQYDEKFPRFTIISDWLNLDVSYTKAPSWIKTIPRFQHDRFSDFAALASLGFPEVRADNAIEPRESKYHHVKLPPDEQLLCYDYLYYVCSIQPNEFEFDYGPAWMFVGQHMHWTKALEGMADHYVRKSFGIENDTEIETPPFISIHVRHGDFVGMCGDVPEADCFAPLSAILRRVDEVKAEILQRKGVVVNHVIMTSDERNATWWDAVAAHGWYRIDSSDTVPVHGKWYPLLIDAVIQSAGLGFVGTDRSTMSVVARRRVQSWRDGAVRTVKWGRVGSDDH